MACGCSKNAQKDQAQAAQTQQIAEQRRNDLAVERERIAKAAAIANAQKKAS